MTKFTLVSFLEGYAVPFFNTYLCQYLIVTCNFGRMKVNWFLGSTRRRKIYFRTKIHWTWISSTSNFVGLFLSVFPLKTVEAIIYSVYLIRLTLPETSRTNNYSVQWWRNHWNLIYVFENLPLWIDDRVINFTLNNTQNKNHLEIHIFQALKERENINKNDGPKKVKEKKRNENNIMITMITTIIMHEQSKRTGWNRIKVLQSN